MTDTICEYDRKGNLIHFKDSNGYEAWYEYDVNGNCIHSKNSNGFEEWREFDENGKCIHVKDTDDILWDLDDEHDYVEVRARLNTLRKPINNRMSTLNRQAGIINRYRNQGLL